jgi:hypothetical protein
MYQFNNEEVAWQRLQDIQREVENSRLVATNGLPAALFIARKLGERIWWLAGLAMRRPPRRHRTARIQESEATRHIA